MLADKPSALWTRSSQTCRAGDVKSLAAATERNFLGPIQAIIPWASNLYTETLIQRVREDMGADFWGFWMLGGMSGGGMGFIFSPEKKREGQDRLQAIMQQTKREHGKRGSLRHGTRGLRFRHQ